MHREKQKIMIFSLYKQTRTTIIKNIFLISFILFPFFHSSSLASYNTFLSNLQQAGIDTQKLITQPTISRFTLARLLNLIECHDCINPPTTSIEKYTPSYRANFIELQDKDFWDIAYRAAPFQGKDHYYCVAYVGDKDYMRWFPQATSPVCWWQFCGQNHVTNAELIQVIINISAPHIYKFFQTNRFSVKKRYEELPQNSYQNQNLTDQDKEIIFNGYQKCDDKPCTLQSPRELQTYLTYCRFNLPDCNMTDLSATKQGARPISELNILQKVDIIDKQYFNNINIHQLPSAKTVIQILYKIFDIIDCQPNQDYDCDKLDNPQDNCPNHYNPSQKDTNNDGQGDVCDDDIDGDGYKNPIHIVDESNNFNRSAMSAQQEFIDTTDRCYDDPTKITSCQSSNYIVWLSVNIISYTPQTPTQKTQLPLIVSAQAISNTDAKAAQWTISNHQYQGEKISYTFTKAWSYTITTTISWPNNTATANTTLLVSEDRPPIKTSSLTTSNLIYQGGKSINLQAIHLNAKGDIPTTYILQSKERELIKTQYALQAQHNTNVTLYQPWPQIITQKSFSANCQELSASTTLVITPANDCQKLYQQSLSWTLQNCDMDHDKIPDICDDDIDGDGIKNLIGIILKDNADCSLDQNNLNRSLIGGEKDKNNHIWFNNLSCQLDNCPFARNPDQSDVNRDSQGDLCQLMIQALIDGNSYTLSGSIYTSKQKVWPTNSIVFKDKDNDHIVDDKDACPTIPEDYNGYYDSDGCPELGENNPCQQIPIITPPNPDYCKEPYPQNCICKNLSTAQCCQTYWLDCGDDDDPDEDENQCNYPYGAECLCFGLTPKQCCEKKWQDCPKDHCKAPYPENCQCKGLSAKQCCEKFKLDCPQDPDDPEDDESKCKKAPFGKECLCFGLTDQQCCQQHKINCSNPPSDDYCKAPYPDDCKCKGQTTKQCCEKFKLDCPSDPDDPGDNGDDKKCTSPYGSECLCFGLTKKQCCNQHKKDCPSTPNPTPGPNPNPNPNPTPGPNPNPNPAPEDEGYINVQNCTQCPCHFADFSSSVTSNDVIKALLRDQSKIWKYALSSPHGIKP